jgi:short-subunit dehydrogenase
MSRPIAFITGASSGIGKELAIEMAKRGYNLSLAARRQDVIEELAESLTVSDTKVLTSRCDVSNQDDVRSAISNTISRFGRIDLAILSAGIGGETDPMRWQSKTLETIVETNLFGVAYCLEELIPIMRSQGEGSIGVLSSLAADRGIPTSAAYCASKAAVSSLCEGLRGTLRKNGIRLMTIEPGYVRTPMTARFKRMPLVMEADAAARLIANRMERGNRVIRFPFLASLFMKVMKMMPNSIFDAVTAKTERTHR